MVFAHASHFGWHRFIAPIDLLAFERKDGRILMEKAEGANPPEKHGAVMTWIQRDEILALHNSPGRAQCGL